MKMNPAHEHPLHLGLLSDFNAQNLAVLLRKNGAPATVTCALGPFGQTTALLLNERADFWSESLDGLVVWTLPERVIPSFQRVLAFEEFSLNDVLAEVDAFASALKRISERIGAVLVPSWLAPRSGRGLGPMD